MSERNAAYNPNDKTSGSPKRRHLSRVPGEVVETLNKQVEELKTENAELRAKLVPAEPGRTLEGQPKSARRTLADTPTGQLANLLKQSR